MEIATAQSLFQTLNMEDNNSNCNDGPEKVKPPPRMMPLTSRSDFKEAMDLVRRMKNVRKKIGRYSHKLMQDGQQTDHMTREHYYYSIVYTIEEGDRMDVQRKDESKDLEGTILTSLHSLDQASEWTKEKPGRECQVEIWVKWFKHTIQSRQGRISENDKVPQQFLLTTLSTTENFLTGRVNITKSKASDTPAEEDAPPKRSRSPKKKEEKKRKRERSLDRKGKVSADFAPPVLKDTSLNPRVWPALTERPSITPPVDDGDEYVVWKRHWQIWRVKHPEETRDLTPLDPSFGIFFF